MKLNKFFNHKNNFYSIFLFHGVVKKNNFGIRNYNKKHILEKEFLSILKELKKKGNCISIDELIYFKKNKINLKKNTFLITFDDGFENNYSVAAPILDDLKLPTTFYFSTEFIEKNSMSWIDKIEHCLQETNIKYLKLPWLKKKISIKDNNRKIYTAENIRKYIKPRLNFKIDSFLNNISSQTKVKILNNTNYEIDKKINWKKIKKMNQNSLFTFGGHSHEHKSLASFNNKSLIKQIDMSINFFKKKSKIDLMHYSYPEGTQNDFNKNIINILKKRKIISCPTALFGYNKLEDDLFKLKRIMI